MSYIPQVETTVSASGFCCGTCLPSLKTLAAEHQHRYTQYARESKKNWVKATPHLFAPSGYAFGGVIYTDVAELTKDVKSLTRGGVSITRGFPRLETNKTSSWDKAHLTPTHTLDVTRNRLTSTACDVVSWFRVPGFLYHTQPYILLLNLHAEISRTH